MGYLVPNGNKVQLFHKYITIIREIADVGIVFGTGWREKVHST